ncbi:8-amino-7-oxononanoate synthase [Campylobacter pinnipediorum subsp. caledonicus]|uniref:8-amino-7-oxononanoate synthase n=1 Tax=Campylobacter pinnipediorum subsp. caledonicus TaxID=1874362 RepID=A0A1S6U7J3_9BACT|nr:aminotransferase class I/II-fold pyridoxal phosphate-dependent enzyme [Campylobacter pinnipediorum]AQW87437.1 8-amino-7-oxononanoate synthase [Campylobacter pinnipediorum subsp. caledonicus]
MIEINNILEELENNFQKRELQNIKTNGLNIIKNKNKLLNLASNDYLGIASTQMFDDEFIKSTLGAPLKFSASSSRSLSGNHNEFEKLEQYLQNSYQNNKKALLFNSGYHLNVGVIAALSGIKNILFLIDRQAHASMYDGLKQGGANFKRYRHNDLNHLEELIQKNQNEFKYIIVLTEALFSMDGDFADIVSLVNLKQKYENILLYIDEAHSVGACGENGLGLVKASGFAKEVDFVVFTFGKAVASIGATLLCEQNFKDFFINKARSLIYSTALPQINVAYTHFIFKKIEGMNAQRKELIKLGYDFKSILTGNKINAIGDAHIISIITKSSQIATKLAKKLEQNGYYAPAIRPPTVAPNSSRIRISLNSLIKLQDLNKLIEVVCYEI